MSRAGDFLIIKFLKPGAKNFRSFQWGLGAFYDKIEA
jgi:hypothetical protein